MKTFSQLNKKEAESIHNHLREICAILNDDNDKLTYLACQPEGEQALQFELFSIEVFNHLCRLSK